MRCRDTQLHGLPAVTESGQTVGKLSGLVVDTASHDVVQYAVRKSGALSKLLPRELLVSRGQVVSLDDRQLVVRDSVAEELAAEREAMVAPAPEPGAALNRSSD
ncbi:MAG: PRC-barrel domain-containing protein [bacterium]